MTEPRNVWEFLAAQCRDENTAGLMVVAENQGESPGKPGFKMAVAADGTLCGTIGGGKMEHDFVEECRGMLRHGDTQPAVRRKVLRAKTETDGSGMLCGGVQTVLLYPVSCGNLAAIEDAVLAARGECAGRLHISPAGITFERDAHKTPSPAFRHADESDWVYEEDVGITDTVYLAGGGHVSLALSRLLTVLEFRVIVFDNRPDVETLKANQYADKIVIGPFDEFGTHVPDGDGSYVVIMTPSHRADELVLRQVAARPLRYVGMMASKTKRATILANLRRDGFDEDVLESIHTPIGIPMRSHTAAEIAVSIAAELIDTRNRE